jgi:hypothetical protein
LASESAPAYAPPAVRCSHLPLTGTLVDPERWRLLDEHFHAALAMHRELRTEYIARVCADDPEMRAELFSLLEACESSAEFLEPPARDSTSPAQASR